MKQVTIKLTRSLIGRPQNQVKTAQALGLTKIGKEVQRPDNDVVRGMIRTISHIVEVKEA